MQEVEISPHLSESRCADLVLGTLTPSERSAALAHAERCPACEARLRAHTAASARAELAARERFAPVGPPRSIVFPARAWIAVAAAAALIAVVGLPTWFQPARLEPQRWLPTPGADIRLREGEHDAHLEAGLAAYARRDLKQARHELAQARVTGGAETARRLYLSNTLLALDEPDEALSLLLSVDFSTVPEPWQEEALWSLQLAYRRTGQATRADSLQRVLEARSPEHP